MVNNSIVTIGVASYNNSRFITETLDSIKRQTYPFIELIIVDDCSKDDSVAIIQQWIDKNENTNVRLLVHNVNKGVCAVCNTILDAAKGEYVSIVGSDDIYMPNKVEVQVKLFKELPADYAIVHSDIYIIDSEGNESASTQMNSLEPGFVAAEGNVFNKLLEQNQISAPSVMLRTAAVREVGGYDESLNFEDWDMWLRLSQKYKVKFSDYLSVKYRVLATSAWNTRGDAFYITSIKILLKNLGVSAQSDAIIAKQVAAYAQMLYSRGYKDAAKWFQTSFMKAPKIKTALLLVMSKFGLPYSIYNKFAVYLK